MSENYWNCYGVKFELSDFELSNVGPYDDDLVGYDETYDLFKFFLSESESEIDDYVIDWSVSGHLSVSVIIECSKSEFDELIDSNGGCGQIPDFLDGSSLFCSVIFEDYELMSSTPLDE